MLFASLTYAQTYQKEYLIIDDVKDYPMYVRITKKRIIFESLYIDDIPHYERKKKVHVYHSNSWGEMTEMGLYIIKRKPVQLEVDKMNMRIVKVVLKKACK